ncbi:MAG: tail fiber domain-containing protein [Patescibacteria group bacterium]|jgi:hypothetical protein
MNWKTFFKKGKLLMGIPILLLGVFVFLQPSFAKNFIIAPNSTDRVSIGTTAAPGYTLDVAGTGRFTGALIVPAPSTANEAATKAYVDSVAATGGISGSGTISYVPLWTGSASLGNSIAYQTATGIGIGNTSPSYKLDVSGTGRFTGTLIVPTPSATSHAATKGYVDSIIGGYVSGSGTTNALTKWSSASGLTNSRITDTGSGNVVVNAVLQATSFSGNLSGNATSATTANTATSLAANGTNCSTGYYARGVDASGNAESCTAVPSTVAYATSLAANGTNCSTGYYARGVDASGNAESCTAVPTGGHGDGTNCSAGYYPLGVDASGNVQSCTAVPTIPFNPTFGTVTAASYLYSSDAKLKTDIKTINDPLEKITALRGVTFNWKDSKEASVGLIAQEVEKVFPELVETNGQYKAVEYGNLVAPLIEAIKAQQQQIEQLEARIVSLESNR